MKKKWYINKEISNSDNILVLVFKGKPDSWRVISLDNYRKGNDFIHYKNTI